MSNSYLILLPPFLEMDFLTQLAPLTSGARYSFLVKGGSVHCRMFRNNSGLCPLDRYSSISFPTFDYQNVSTYCSMFLEGKITPFGDYCCRGVY